MQSPFGSVSLVAQAYERELRAEAARTRSVPMAETGRDGGESAPGRYRRAVGGPVRAWQLFESAGDPRRRQLECLVGRSDGRSGSRAETSRHRAAGRIR